MRKINRLFLLTVALALLLSACSTTAPTTIATTAATTAATKATTTAVGATTQAGTTVANSGNVTSSGDASKVYIGVVAGVTGTNKAIGGFVKNAADLAAEEINANGGILGKKVELVYADEVDNLQASVNATNMLLSDKKIAAVFGSTYSQNVLAVLPAVLQAKMPYMAGGSSPAIANEKNPYVWQARNRDSFVGKVIATYATKTLNMKKPALIFSTLSSLTANKDATLAALKELGVVVPDNRIFGYPEDEKNFAPIVTQIMNSGCDGIIGFGNQQPWVLVCKAFADAGCTLPRIGSSSVSSGIVLKNAGNASNGWYSAADFTPYINTEVGQKFQKNYFAKYGIDTEQAPATAYDSLYLIKYAMENAKTTVDRDAINKGFEKIKDVPGVLGIFSFHDDHSFPSKIYITKNEDGKALMVDSVSYR